MHKVLFVITSLGGGGAERTLSNLTTNFPLDWEIDILIARNDKSIYPYRGNIIDLGIKEQKNYNNILYRIKVFLKKLTTLRKMKKQNHYTVCISFMTRANVLNILSGKKYCKTIISVRNDYRHERTSKSERIANKIERLLSKKADLVVSLSNGVRDYLVRDLHLSAENVITIYNGFNFNNYTQVKSPQNKSLTTADSKDLFSFITTGRLTDQKGQWHLIRAFAHLNKKYPKCTLTILGEGPLRQYLEMLVNEYGVGKNVSLVGFVENTFEYYYKSSAFVFTSLYEGFGNVLIEAMMCSLPVISSDCFSGPREILAPDTNVSYQLKDNMECAEYGILVPSCSGTRYNANDPLELQEQILFSAMEKVLTDCEIRKHYAEQSTQRTNDFSIETAVEKWVEVIE